MTIEDLRKQIEAIPKEELIEKVDQILSDLCHGGKKFRMTVPPNRYDSDLLIAELIRRYKES